MDPAPEETKKVEEPAPKIESKQVEE